MRLNIEVELDYHFPAAADVLLAVEVAQLADQRLIEDLLTVNGSDPLRTVAGEDGIGRRTWMRAQGPFRAAYRATLDIARPNVAIDSLPATPHPELPAGVVAYLWPSRYCEADRFEAFVQRHFGDLEGGAKLLAMRD